MEQLSKEIKDKEKMQRLVGAYPVISFLMSGLIFSTLVSSHRHVLTRPAKDVMRDCLLSVSVGI